MFSISTNSLCHGVTCCRRAIFSLVFTIFLPIQCFAGFITFDVLEFKGHIVIPGVPQTTIKIVDSGSVPNTPNYIIKRIQNVETVEIPGSAVDLEYDLYNFYTSYIEIPDAPPIINPYFIHFYWMMLADYGTGIGPLEHGMKLISGSMFGNTGTEYMATLTPINDLSALPTQNPDGLQIGWDVSALSQLTGNFYLAHAIIPSNEVFFIPEPSGLALIGIGVACLFGFSRRKVYRPIA